MGTSVAKYHDFISSHKKRIQGILKLKILQNLQNFKGAQIRINKH